MKRLQSIRVRAALLVVFLAVIGLNPLQAAVLTLTNVGEAWVDIRHTGTPGATQVLLISPPLGQINSPAGVGLFDLAGVTAETSPGVFEAHDPWRLYFPARFYQTVEGVDPGILAWMNTYPIFYLDGMEADPIPRFEWAAFPLPGAVYELNVFEGIPNGDGVVVPVPRPILSVTNLTDTHFQFGMGDPTLQPTAIYFYTVTAVVPGLRVLGRPVGFGGHGVIGSTESPDLPGLALIGAATGGGTDWPKLMKLLGEIAQKKQDLRDAFNANPLVQEAMLLDQLVQILKNPEAVKQALLDILSGQLTNLQDPEVVLKALCYMEKLVNFLADHDDSLSAAKKQRLKNFATQIGHIKNALEAAADKTAQLEQTLQDLQNLIDQFTAFVDDPLGYLGDKIKERLLEKIRELLVKKLGEKAAGALFSIVSDLVNLSDALLTVSRIEDLCREYNRLLLEGIAGDPTGVVTPGRKYTATVSETYANCQVTIAYKKMCYQPSPSGGPYDGTWSTTPIHFSDGSATMSAQASTLFDDFAGPGRFRLKFAKNLLPADLACPPGAGPCIVLCCVTYTCPEPAASFSVTLFVGAIRCQ